MGGGEEGGRVEGAWHQVTSYIVQLEKRLKELEQAGGAPTPSAPSAVFTRPVPLQVKPQDLREVVRCLQRTSSY